MQSITNYNNAFRMLLLLTWFYSGSATSGDKPFSLVLWKKASVLNTLL